MAQTGQITKCSGVKWTARTPPKRQVEGSNPSGPESLLYLLIGLFINKDVVALQNQLDISPYERFYLALKSPESKRQYPHRLDKFLTYMEFQGNIEEKCAKLYDFSKNNFDVLQSHLIRFINSQKERIDKKEISEGTLHNYIKAIKLFLTMNDIVINWKKLAKGIPQEKQNADDRIPTMDEIHKLVQHPDRRVKIIAYMMIS